MKTVVLVTNDSFVGRTRFGVGEIPHNCSDWRDSFEKLIKAPTWNDRTQDIQPGKKIQLISFFETGIRGECLQADGQNAIEVDGYTLVHNKALYILSQHNWVFVREPNASFPRRPGASDHFRNLFEEAWRAKNTGSLDFKEALALDMSGEPLRVSFLPNAPLEALKLSNCKLEALPLSIGCCYVLELLILDHNEGLSKLSPSVFESLTQLTYFSASHCNLKTLPPGLFRKCRSLVEVNLSHNQLSEISEEHFSHDEDIIQGLGNLLVLDLSHNRITQCSLPNFPKLKVLNLSSNLLRDFAPRSLGRLSNPKNPCLELDLSHNVFTSIPAPSAFLPPLVTKKPESKLAEGKSDSTEEEENDPREDEYATVEDFTVEIPVTKLFLNGNLISRIEWPLLERYSNLTHLDLSWNLLEKLEPFPFRPNFVSLALECNQLCSIPPFLGIQASREPQLTEAYFDAVIQRPEVKRSFVFSVAGVRGTEALMGILEDMKVSSSKPAFYRERNMDEKGALEAMKLSRYLKLDTDVYVKGWVLAQHKGIASILQEVQGLTGQKDVKDFFDKLAASKTMEIEKASRGIAPSIKGGHLVFVGSPGTGKTTVARMLAQLFSALGVIRKNKLIEASRTELVGSFQGHTGKKVDKVLKKAFGGILFIDEAYSLVQNDKDQFGHEAVDHLIQKIENNRHRLCVVLAGYKREMEEFLQSNPGFSSRIDDTVEFKDYSPEELMEIAVKLFKNPSGAKDNTPAKGYTLDSAAEALLRKKLEHYAGRDAFGNARGVRVIVKNAIKHSEARLLKLITDDKKKGEGCLRLPDSLFTIITREDIEKALPKDVAPQDDFQEVKKRLEALGMSHYVTRFERHGIDSRAWEQLTDHALQEIGVQKVGDRLRILRK